MPHAYHGHVNRLVAVGVEAAQNVADDPRRLAVWPVATQPHVVHGVEDAPLHRLEPILDAGQRPVGDGLDRVLEVGLLQVGGQGNGLSQRCTPLIGINLFLVR